MRRTILLALAMTLAIAGFGCVLAKQPSPRGAALTNATSPDSSALKGAAAVNAFGLDLMRTRLEASDTPTGNVVFSPLSVHAALSMALQGAGGKTAAEMERTLHLAGSADAAASTYTILLDALSKRSREQTLTVANAIWVDKPLAVRREFLGANRIAFGSAVHTMDFRRDDMASVVNRWVEAQTHGMIKEIVQRIDPNAVMLLANAVYFKATWIEPFEKWATQPEAFHFSPTRTADVETMHSTGQLPIVQTGAYSATKLEYRGRDSAAYLILPRGSHTLGSVLTKMTAKELASVRTHLDSKPTTLTALSLPKFDITVASGLNDTLAEMGMPTAFDSEKADFRSMATPPPGQNIWIGSVIHKARIKVDESGTEAAAATVIEMTAGAMATKAPPRPFQFTCDRPFAVAIVDTRTGALLFLAAINDPAGR